MGPVLVFSCESSPEVPLAASSAPISQIYVQKAENASGGVLDLFFFEDEPGYVLDSYQRIDAWDGSPLGGASRSGAKVLVAFANYASDRYSYGAMNCLQTLSETAFPLWQENPSLPMMSGVEKLEAGEDCTLNLYPSLSRILLRSICCDFSGKPYEGETLSDVKIYLINVCSEYRPLSRESISWINMGLFSELDSGRLSHPEMLYSSLDGGISSSVRYPDISLYCYPNLIPEETMNVRFTRLVIEGTIMGQKCYYPINVNRSGFGYISGEEGLSAAKNYLMDITLTRLGTDDPDKPVSSDMVTVRTSVLPWYDYPEYVVRY